MSNSETNLYCSTYTTEQQKELEGEEAHKLIKIHFILLFLFVSISSALPFLFDFRAYFFSVYVLVYARSVSFAFIWNELSISFQKSLIVLKSANKSKIQIGLFFATHKNRNTQLKKIIIIK